MSIKLKIKTKKHCITWDLNKFTKNIIIPTMLIAGFVALGFQTLIKANIFQVY